MRLSLALQLKWLHVKMFSTFFSILLILGYVSCGDAKFDRDSKGIYRFGPECAFLCHCLNASEQCDFSTGDCTSGCDWEWGGPGCQYRNVAFKAFSRNLDNLPSPQYSDLANDNDISSCSETGDETVYRINHPPDYPRKFSPWWKVWFPDNVTFLEFTILTRPEKLGNFRNFNVTVEYVPETKREDKTFYPPDFLLCYSNQNVVPSSTTITVICDRPLVGNQLRIQLEDIRSQLVICDIRILQGRNVAFAKPAEQSSSHPAYRPSFAVDGNTDHYPYTWDVSPEPSWTVSIGFMVNVSCIRIFWSKHSADSGEYSILSSNDSTQWTRVYISSTYPVDRITNIMTEVTARVFRVNQTYRPMAMSEVQIFGDCIDDVCGLDCSKVCHCKKPTLQDKMSGVCSSGCQDEWIGIDGKCDTEKQCESVDGVLRYGQDCDLLCHCLDPKEQCNINSGDCTSGCDWEWGGPGCQYKNIALKERVRHLDNVPTNQLYANLAVDMDLLTCSETDYENSTRNDPPWWKVWFSRNETFKELTLLTRSGTREYFSDFKVTVENVTEDQFRDKDYYPTDSKLCYTNRKKIPSSSLIHILCDEPVVGNQLRLQLGNTKTQLVICDIRILKECSSGKWGHDCVNSCGHCKDELKCRASDGKCSHGCAPGYKETKLCNTECDNGTYGPNCREMCGRCKDSNVCNKTNGTCQSECAAGFTGDRCITECISGKWGDACSNNCGHCKDEHKCQVSDGACPDGCAPGYKETKLCTTECDNGKYGQNCSEKCGHCKDSNVCNKTNGTCQSGCVAGYTGDKCNTAPTVPVCSTPSVMTMSTSSPSNADILTYLKRIESRIVHVEQKLDKLDLLEQKVSSLDVEMKKSVELCAR